ncbi:MAG: HlyD family efflux transporter periplasmic adaptor subunit [Azonexus sp.]
MDADFARPLPPLREDLRILEAAPEADGSPAWVIHDPVVNRFYRIGWLEFECLLRWGAPAAVVAADIAAMTPLQTDADQVVALAGFLDQHQLLRPGPEATDRQASRSATAPWLKWRWWLHHYLFFRIPLVRPQVFLARAARQLSLLFRPAALWALALPIGLGLLLVYREWDVFSTAVVDSLSPRGLLGFAGALFLAKTLHELGHALVATHFGVRVAHMGIAFVVMWPMLYTDTGESWKLRSRHQRLAVSAAGILTELALAGLATLGWALSEPGWLHTACLYLATTSWMLSLALNASPFMRFDGYFILSDLLDFPNLHERSSALAKVALRRTLLGLDEPWTEHFPDRQRRLLIGFALATWLYRLVVFLGIAVAVYLFFFKLLGIFLFAVELAWFVALPIWRELKVWWGRRDEVRSSRRRFLAFLAGILLLLVAIPWKTEVRGAGVAHAARQSAVFAPYPAVIVSVRQGGPVVAGDVLVKLDSPDLRAQGSRSEAKVQALASQLTGLQSTERGLDQASATNERLSEQLAEVQATGEELSRLKLRADFTGIWLDLDPQKQAGTWVNSKEPLGMLIDPRRWQVDAFVDQANVERLLPGASAIFYPEHRVDAVRGKVLDVDSTPVSRLDQPMLATRHGGPIALASQAQDLIPSEPQFRVRVELDEPLASSWEVRGQLAIEGTRRSPLGDSLRNLLAVLIRESGF